MPDIILNTSFTNASLPSLPGFVDTFNRANGALGNGWQPAASGTNSPAVVNVVDNAAAVVAGESGVSYTNGIYLKDSCLANATVRVVIKNIGDRTGALVLRGTTPLDNIAINWRTSSSNSAIMANMRIPGTATPVGLGSAPAAQALVNGDVIEARAYGTSLKVYRNCTLIIDAVVPAPAAEQTRHGMYAYLASAGVGVTYDSFEVTE